MENSLQSELLSIEIMGVPISIVLSDQTSLFGVNDVKYQAYFFVIS